MANDARLPEPSSLTRKQRQRAEALAIARPMLTGTSISGTLRPAAGELVYVAEWILDGSADVPDEPPVTVTTTPQPPIAPEDVAAAVTSLERTRA